MPFSTLLGGQHAPLADAQPLWGRDRPPLDPVRGRRRQRRFLRCGAVPPWRSPGHGLRRTNRLRSAVSARVLDRKRVPPGTGFVSRTSHLRLPTVPGCGSSTRRRWHKGRRCSTSLVSGPNTTATISAPLCETPMATTSRPSATCRSEPGERSGPGFLASHPNPA